MTFDLPRSLELPHLVLLWIASTNNTQPCHTSYQAKVLIVQNTPPSREAPPHLCHLSSWQGLKTEWHLHENNPQGQRQIVIGSLTVPSIPPRPPKPPKNLPSVPPLSPHSPSVPNNGHRHRPPKPSLSSPSIDSPTLPSSDMPPPLPYRPPPYLVLSIQLQVLQVMRSLCLQGVLVLLYWLVELPQHPKDKPPDRIQHITFLNKHEYGQTPSPPGSPLHHCPSPEYVTLNPRSYPTTVPSLI